MYKPAERIMEEIEWKNKKGGRKKKIPLRKPREEREEKKIGWRAAT